MLACSGLLGFICRITCTVCRILYETMAFIVQPAGCLCLSRTDPTPVPAARSAASSLPPRLQRPVTDPINDALQHGPSLQQRGAADLYAPHGGNAAGSSAAAGADPPRSNGRHALTAAAQLGSHGAELKAADMYGDGLHIAAQLQAAASGTMAAERIPGDYSSGYGDFTSGSLQAAERISGDYSSGYGHSTSGSLQAAERLPGDYSSGYGHSTSGSLHSRASRRAQRNLFDVAAEAAVKAAERQARVAAGGAQPAQQPTAGAGSIYSSSLAAANGFAAADSTATAGDQGRSGAWHPADSEPAPGRVNSHQHRAGGTHTSSRATTAAGSGSEGNVSTAPQPQLPVSGRRGRHSRAAHRRPRSRGDSPEHADFLERAASGDTSPAGAAPIADSGSAAGTSAGGGTRGGSSGAGSEPSDQPRDSSRRRRVPEQPAAEPAGGKAATQASHEEATSASAAVQRNSRAGHTSGTSAPQPARSHQTLSPDNAWVPPDNAQPSSSASGSRPASRDAKSHVESWLHGIASPASHGARPDSGAASGSGRSAAPLAAAAATAASPGADRSAAYGSSMEELSAPAVAAAAGSPLVAVAPQLPHPEALAAHRIDVDDSEVSTVRSPGVCRAFDCGWCIRQPRSSAASMITISSAAGLQASSDDGDWASAHSHAGTDTSSQLDASGRTPIRTHPAAVSALLAACANGAGEPVMVPLHDQTAARMVMWFMCVFTTDSDEFACLQTCAMFAVAGGGSGQGHASGGSGSVGPMRHGTAAQGSGAAADALSGYAPAAAGQATASALWHPGHAVSSAHGDDDIRPATAASGSSQSAATDSRRGTSGSSVGGASRGSRAAAAGHRSRHRERGRGWRPGQPAAEQPSPKKSAGGGSSASLASRTTASTAPGQRRAHRSRPGSAASAAGLAVVYLQKPGAAVSTCCTDLNLHQKQTSKY
jgi:hypothetical protein